MTDEGQPLTIGVGVMAYCGWRNDADRGAQIYTAYLGKMTSFVVWLLDRGHLVRILMGDQADRRAVDDLVRAVRSRRPERTADSILFEPAQTLHDVMQQMADTDLVVATRYHNVVCALRMGRPTISIGYSVKNDALLAGMGLADCCQSIERLDVALLETQTLRLISERPALEARIRRGGRALRRQPAGAGGPPCVPDRRRRQRGAWRRAAGSARSRRLSDPLSSRPPAPGSRTAVRAAARVIPVQPDNVRTEVQRRLQRPRAKTQITPPCGTTRSVPRRSLIRPCWNAGSTPQPDCTAMYWVPSTS